MKDITFNILENTILRYPALISIKDVIIEASNILLASIEDGGKILICGNGGSSADADHIVGELMKGFNHKRKLDQNMSKAIDRYDSSGVLKQRLQGTIRAINLSAHNALGTAISNDLGDSLIFAQQVLGYGARGDVLIGISTSGNAQNVINAGIVARSVGMKTIGLTGNSPGRMDNLFETIIQAPAYKTYEIQEFHLPIYHALCAMLEEEIFGYSEGK